MTIEFCLNNIDGFLPAMAQQVGLPIEDNILRLPKDHGEGFFTQYVFGYNLVVAYYELHLINPTTIIRHKSKTDKILPIIFWASNAGVTQKINSGTKPIGKGTQNGISFSSSNIDARYSFPADVSIKSICILIDKKWLQNIVKNENNYISKYIIEQEKYFIYEETNHAMEDLMNDIEHTIKHKANDTLSVLHLNSLALSLADMFFAKLLKRSSNNKFINIKPCDIESLFKIKNIVANNYINFPTIGLLAKESGMNERKLQKLFKQVFGKSIYQFALTLKMKEAQKLLETRKYSVSEVGYLVGYSNLSHFSQKFKEHVGIAPKSFLSVL